MGINTRDIVVMGSCLTTWLHTSTEDVRIRTEEWELGFLTYFQIAVSLYFINIILQKGNYSSQIERKEKQLFVKQLFLNPSIDLSSPHLNPIKLTHTIIRTDF